MAINFISFKDPNETRPMHTKSDNIEIMIGNETDEVTEELFNSLLQRYKKIEKNQWKEVNFSLIALIY